MVILLFFSEENPRTVWSSCSRSLIIKCLLNNNKDLSQQLWKGFNIRLDFEQNVHNFEQTSVILNKFYVILNKISAILNKIFIILNKTSVI